MSSNCIWVIESWKCIVQQLLWRPVLLTYCQLLCCYGAPCRDHYIPSFVCQQCPYSRPPGRVMYCRVDKIARRHLKMWTGSCRAWLLNLLKMIQSEWTCLWMFGFHCRTVVLAETDYLHIRVQCDPQLSSRIKSQGSFNKCEVYF